RAMKVDKAPNRCMHPVRGRRPESVTASTGGATAGLYSTPPSRRAPRYYGTVARPPKIHLLPKEAHWSLEQDNHLALSRLGIPHYKVCATVSGISWNPCKCLQKLGLVAAGLRRATSAFPDLGQAFWISDSAGWFSSGIIGRQSRANALLCLSSNTADWALACACDPPASKGWLAVPGPVPNCLYPYSTGGGRKFH